jgi:repressor LexA
MAKRSSPTGARRSRSQKHQADEAACLQIQRSVADSWYVDGRSSSVREISAASEIGSLSVLARHVNDLVAQGLLCRLPGSRRLLPARPPGLEIRGMIAARSPRDLFDEGDFELLDCDGLSSALPGNGLPHQREVYALRVRGDSIVDNGILDGDFVLIAPSPAPARATIAVTVHDSANGGRDEATLKWVFVYEDEVRLKPADPAYAALVIGREKWDQEWGVQGALVGAHRRYTV